MLFPFDDVFLYQLNVSDCSKKSNISFICIAFHLKSQSLSYWTDFLIKLRNIFTSFNKDYDNSYSHMILYDKWYEN